MEENPEASEGESETGDAGKGLRCPVCGWTDVRRSRPKGVVDGLVRMVGLVPYRCRSCGQRFYRGKHDDPEAEE